MDTRDAVVCSTMEPAMSGFSSHRAVKSRTLVDKFTTVSLPRYVYHGKFTMVESRYVVSGNLPHKFCFPTYLAKVATQIMISQ